MAKDVLSQNEIDSLISALSSGDLSLKEKESELPGDSKLVPYDFRRPNRFSKDQMRTMKNIHEIFARRLTNFLTAFLRIPVTIKLESASQVTYEEFVNSLPLPTLLTIFRLSKNNGSALLETNPYFNFPIIDILFGGEGDVVRKTRELTEIELKVMHRVSEKVLNCLSYAWEDMVEMSPEIEYQDTNPQYNQLFASNEAVVLLSFSTSIAGNDGFLNLCLPYITLEPILARLSAQNWHSRQAKAGWSPANVRSLEKRLSLCEVELTAVLGETEITVSDFLNFEEGDIILLNSLLNKPVDLCLDGKPMFRVNLGTLGNRMAVEITGITFEGEEAV
jgi:flagellar motor switch protein FliM